MRQIHLFCLISLATITACKTPTAEDYDFPEPVDTTTKPITFQKKTVYDSPARGISFDNLFDGARLNGLREVSDTLFVVTIEPENEPINHSPWYAFRISAEEATEVTVRLDYGDSQHRYFPKLSTDFENWTPLDSSRLTYNEDSTAVDLRLNLAKGTTYVAAQEVMNSTYVGAWMKGFRLDPRVRFDTIGSSRLGRPLKMMDIYEGDLRKRETIVLLSRQHPPEVTGFMALQGFLDQLLMGPRNAEFFRRYRVLVYPLINPDGVDLGHWRHNAGGVDLNRDWAYYHQPETRAVANSVVRRTREARGRVILGLDFHSTWYDVYYTKKEDVATVLPAFSQDWLAGIEAGMGGDFRINEQPGVVGRPTSASWFTTQFGAEGITYEIGDSTPRDFVSRKGRISADVMVDLLLARE